MANGSDGDIKLTVTLDDKELTKSARALRMEIKNIFDGAAGTQVSEAFQKIQIQMDKVSTESRKVAKEMDALKNKKVPTEQYQSLENELKRLETSYTRINEKTKRFLSTGGSLKSDAFKRLAYDAKEVENKISAIKAQMERLRSTGNAFSLGSATSEYARLQERQGQLTNTMALLINKAKQFGEAGRSSAETVGRSVNKLPSLFSSAAKYAGKLADALGRITAKGLSAIGTKLKNIIPQFRKSAQEATGFTRSLSLRKILMYAFGIRSLYFLFRKLRTAIKEGLQNMALFHDGNNEVNRSLSQLISSLLYLKNSWAAAFAPIITAVMPLLTALIDKIATAANYLAAFFAMLTGKSTFLRAKKNYQDYASTVTKDSNTATKAVKKFKAELYGFDELNQQQEKDTGSDSGSGAGGGTGISPDDMFEETSVESFLPQAVQDWITKLKEAWAKGDWEGVGKVIAQGINTALKFTDDWINNKFSPWAEKWAGRIARILNGAVKELDWELLGKTVADGINAVFKAANKFLKTFKWEEFGKGLGRAIKSWFDNVDWKLIGETFANKWNALIDTIHGIVSTKGLWASIGVSVGQFIKSWFTTIKWKTLVDDVVKLVNGIVEAINKALKEVTAADFISAGKEFSDRIIQALTDINWAKMGKTISELAQRMWLFLLTVDWVKIGDSIGKALADLITNIDWLKLLALILATNVKIIAGVITGIVSLLQAMVGKLGPMFKKAGFDIIAKFFDSFRNFDITKPISKFVSTITKAFTSIPSKIIPLFVKVWSTIFAALDLNRYITGVIQLIIEFRTFVLTSIMRIISTIGGVLANAFKAIGLDTIGGFIQGISDKIADAATAITNFVTTVIDVVKTILGIKSPSKVFAEIGANVVAGLLQGISNAWHTIIEFFSRALSSLSSSLSKAWSNITKNASTAWTAFKKAISTIVTNFKTSVVNIMGVLKSNVSSKFSALKTAVTTTMSNMKSRVSSLFSSMKSAVTSATSSLVSSVRSKFSNLYSAVSSKVSSLKSSVVSKWRALKSTMKSVDFSSVGSSMVSGLLSGLQSAWSSVTSWASSAASSVANTMRSVLQIHSPSKVFMGIGVNIAEGLVQGLNKGNSTITKAVKTNAKTTISAGVSALSGSKLIKNNTKVKNLTSSKNTAQKTTPTTHALVVTINQNVTKMLSAIKTISTTLSKAKGTNFTNSGGNAIIGVDFDKMSSNITNIMVTMSQIGSYVYDIQQKMAQTPAIVQGRTVSPLITKKIATKSSESGNENLSTTLTNAIQTALMNVEANKTGSQSNQSQVVRIDINGREVFNAVVKENNKSLLRTGTSPLIA